jgi:uncharacterized repeat protein (TIGR01451 family)
LAVSKSVQPTGSVAPGDTLTYEIEVTNEGLGPASNTTITDIFAAGLTNPVCNGVSGNLVDTVVINPAQSVTYTCTAVIDPSLALTVEITADPPVILSGEQVTYTISVTNSGNLSLSNVQVSAPGVTNCTPALDTPQTLGPGASQLYTCPNNTPASPAATTATATGELTLSNEAHASDPDDPGGSQSSGAVNTQVMVTGRGSVAVYFSDYFYGYLPLVIR